MRSYEKYVDAGAICTNNETATKCVYVVRFDLNGRVKLAERPELHELLEFHPNGRLKAFVVEDYREGKYTWEYYKASWDETGKLLREGLVRNVPPK
jgi:hypothetical protein